VNTFPYLGSLITEDGECPQAHVPTKNPYSWGIWTTMS